VKRLGAVVVGVMLLLCGGRVGAAEERSAPGLSTPPVAPAPARGPVVAQVGPVSVTMDQLQRPLTEAYGLNLLLNLVQLEVAKENAVRAGVKVTPQDIQQE